ncbi:methylamine utilization protein [Sphingorhabdus sp.]|uniref:methylamine utilization protein n=1 Tax=Sphingorhabdus sp. TaxID=1902408 RepID=UPI0039834088
MQRFALQLLTVFACLSLGVAATGATESSVSVTVKDARGIPVQEAVVMVYPKTGTNKPMRFGPSVMAQRDLAFAPGTLIAAKGSSVSFPNFDRVRHSVYSFSKTARFEINLYGKEQSRSQKFPIAGSVALGCNIHDNMRGYIKVVDTPFAAKTDRNGVVNFNGLTAGAGTVKIWHPQARAAGNEVAFNTSLTAGGNERRYELNVRQD